MELKDALDVIDHVDEPLAAMVMMRTIIKIEEIQRLLGVKDTLDDPYVKAVAMPFSSETDDNPDGLIYPFPHSCIE